MQKKIDLFLKNSFCSNLEFAGISVLLVGYIQQLLPIKSKPLWTQINRDSDSLSKIQVKLLFQKNSKNLKLTRVMRQFGKGQSRFRKILSTIGIEKYYF